jgi:hypothetical protein
MLFTSLKIDGVVRDITLFHAFPPDSKRKGSGMPSCADVLARFNSILVYRIDWQQTFKFNVHDYEAFFLAGSSTL